MQPAEYLWPKSRLAWLTGFQPHIPSEYFWWCYDMVCAVCEWVYLSISFYFSVDFNQIYAFVYEYEGENIQAMNINMKNHVKKRTIHSFGLFVFQVKMNTNHCQYYSHSGIELVLLSSSKNWNYILLGTCCSLTLWLCWRYENSSALLLIAANTLSGIAYIKIQNMLERENQTLRLFRPKI